MQDYRFRLRPHNDGVGAGRATGYDPAKAMFTCPNCQSGLARETCAKGVFWDCPRCHGRVMGVGLLRQLLDHRCVAAAWALVLRATENNGRPCPVCLGAMVPVTLDVDGKSPEMEVCKRCEFIWFDAGQYELLPPPPPKLHALGEINEWELPQQAREALALERIKQIAKEANQQGGEAPDEAWKAFPAVLGLPVEMDSDPINQRPWGTWLIAALITAVSIASFFHLEPIVRDFGLIPADAWRDHGLTLLSSFFLHADIFHLAGNLYFLIIFGRHVEDYLGHWRWLLLLFAATLVGDACLILMTPRSTIPCIGASGGISGLLAFYALRFPHARLGILFGYSFLFRWIQFPAWSVLLLWLLFQCLGAYEEIAGIGRVASLAHLGGALAGFLFWLAWRKLDAPAPVAASSSPALFTRQ